MNMTEIFYATGAMIASTGAAAAIIFGLSSWLGKVWASRILEKDRLSYGSELEKIKNKLQIESQQQQIIFSLYFEGQFKRYNELWESLIKLQNCVEELWRQANKNNLRQLVRALENSKKQIQNSALSIEPEHYSEIMNAIDFFKVYHDGKERLINTRSIHEMNSEEIEKIIDSNKNIKDQINKFVTIMHGKMQKQIGGNIGPIKQPS